MTKRMLIDATHEEETRVAVTDGKRLEEFDYESKFRKPMKGSIYLAKVTRVEPSLQAAFVNFGGNRHGFLPFSEIHPDYFRIPIADREALMAEQEALLAEDDEEDEVDEEENAEAEDNDDIDAEDDSEDDDESDEDDDNIGNKKSDDEKSEDEDGDDESKNKKDGGHNQKGRGRRGGRGRGRGGRGGGKGRGRNAQHRSRSSEKYDDDISPEQRFRQNLRRKYKIQEVIKRGQIMLVQASKEERGNKGAAVSSYLSLPGRYCVLMPNSPRGGGVSRKIASYKDRARMRDIMKTLEVPKGMSVILRTAGVERTKAEIKRDLDYLMRLWDNIRELTLQSSAPSMIYEEADLIKRAVRDLYTRDVEEILVAGDEGYQIARNFMKMMIPSHVKKVKEYKEKDIPLFNRYQVEGQIAEIGEMQVTLPSGGYLVINPTEALVSVDVNSGKATKQRHIEETALHTNLEAAEEMARQMRLRDLGGLIVIDFIDMENRRNNGKVERKMRDALSGDRARVQAGRISNFGLMELSRQRLNPSLTESQFKVCAHCNGSGRIRTADGASIMVLRAIEDEGMRGRAAALIAHVPNEVAQYLLNNKRKTLNDLEGRYKFKVQIRVDEELSGGHFRVEVSKPADNQDGGGDSEETSGKDGKDAQGKDENKEPRKGRRRGRRGGRRRGRRDENKDQPESLADALDQGGDSEAKDNKADDKKPRGRKKAEEAKDDKPDDKKGAAKKPSSRSKKADEKPADKKDEKADKPAPKKAVAKKSDASKTKKADDKKDEPKKGAAKSKAKDKSSKPSNDDKKAQEARAYEKVNEAPSEKKKGWWNRLGGE